MRFLLIIYQAIMSRMAGGGIWVNRPAGLGEWLFAVPIAAAAGMTWIPHDLMVGLGLLMLLWTYAWMQTGHAVAFHMGAGENYAAAGRMEFLSHIINPITKALGLPLGGQFFCWSFMMLKGLLIHAPLGLWALPAALLWAIAYYIGNIIVSITFPRVDGEMVAELLAGAFSGFCVAMAM